MTLWTHSTVKTNLIDVDNMRVWNVWADARLVISDVTKRQASHICTMHNEELAMVGRDSISKQEFRDSINS